MQSAAKQPLVCRGHSRPVPMLMYGKPVSSGGEPFYLISGCLDGQAMLRAGTTGDWVGTFLGHKGAVWSAALDSLSVRAVTASADFSVRIWDAINGSELHTFSHNHIARYASFAPDDRSIVTAGQRAGAERLVQRFDLENYAAAPTRVGQHTGDLIRFALFTSDGNAVLSGGCDDKQLCVWDVRAPSGGAAARTLSFANTVMGLDVSSDGKLLVLSTGHDVVFLDAATYETVKTVNVPATNVYSASLHHDGTQLVAGGEDFALRIFDYATGEERECHRGHHGAVNCVRYAPDGETFASASVDGTIRIYQTNASRPYGLWNWKGTAAAAAAE